MFDGLRQRLYQFKEAVSTKELKLDNEAAKISAGETSPLGVDLKKAPSISDQQKDSSRQMAAEPASEYALAAGSEPIVTGKSADKRSFFFARD